MKYKKLQKEFYLQPTITVAKKLLGKLLVRQSGKEFFVGRIVETEAYLYNDVASHSYRGKKKRNEVMFAEGGKLYVYFTYGMYFCSNVVTEEEGKGCAVLLRGIEPLIGIETMAINRGFDAENFPLKNLTSGPAKICQAFSFGRNENGANLLGEEIYIAEDEVSLQKTKIISSSRIGIRKGFGDDRKWRFFINGSEFVSRHKNFLAG